MSEPLLHVPVLLPGVNTKVRVARASRRRHVKGVVSSPRQSRRFVATSPLWVCPSCDPSFPRRPTPSALSSFRAFALCNRSFVFPRRPTRQSSRSTSRAQTRTRRPSRSASSRSTRPPARASRSSRRSSPCPRASCSTTRECTPPRAARRGPRSRRRARRRRRLAPLRRVRSSRWRSRRAARSGAAWVGVMAMAVAGRRGQPRTQCERKRGVGHFGSCVDVWRFCACEAWITSGLQRNVFSTQS